MTADTITAIKKALEGVNAKFLRVLAESPDMRAIALIPTTLEGLRSENERLRQFLFPYADNTEISGISWDGKYLIGDKASISAFREMQNRGLQIDVYKRAYDENVAALKARAEAAESEVKGYRDALAKLESANEALCAMRSQSAYDQMMADGCAGELHDLDVARAAARTALSSTGDTHGN